jgi:hypothetical protein
MTLPISTTHDETASRQTERTCVPSNAQIIQMAMSIITGTTPMLIGYASSNLVRHKRWVQSRSGAILQALDGKSLTGDVGFTVPRGVSGNSSSVVVQCTDESVGSIRDSGQTTRHMEQSPLMYNVPGRVRLALIGRCPGHCLAPPLELLPKLGHYPKIPS